MATGATRYVTIAVVERLTGRVPQQLTAWLKPYRQERTAAGWPVERVVQVLTAHGEAITAEQLLSAAGEPPSSKPPAAPPPAELLAAIETLTHGLTQAQERQAQAERIAREQTALAAATQERSRSLEAEVARLRQQLAQGQPRAPRRPVWAQN